MNTIVRKIPLDGLITHLVDMYNLGVNYIDISGEQGDDYDLINIMFAKEYMDEDFQDNFEHLIDENSIEIEGETFDPNNIDDII